MFTALAWLRIALLLNAVGLNVYRNNFDHVAAGWACIGLMVGWTAEATWLYASPARRTTAVLLVDLGITVALLLATPIVKGPWFSATIPGFWITAALLAWAVRYGWRGGAGVGVLFAAIDLLSRARIEQKDYSLAFLIVLGGTMIGYLCESLQAMATERDAAQRRAAAAEERARLARVVHDGVLQVLALVQRRGSELGGEGAELGRLAGEQEIVLRALVRTHDLPESATAEVDLTDALTRLAADRGAEAAVPGTSVWCSAEVADELVAAVAAALDNVARHVGPHAPAWVLLEGLGEEIVISVRDDGPGIADGRLAAAEGEGRLGVSESIRGRIRDIGGEAILTTGSFGTEWEFTVPR